MPFYKPIEVGDEMRLYYSGFARSFNCPRNYGAGALVGAKKGKRIMIGETLMPAGENIPANGVGVATMRRDGYVSLDAGPRGGVFTTKPFTFEGSRLVLNARALGHVTVELLTADLRMVEGFNRVSLTGNSVRHCVSWPNLKKLSGKPVCLRFLMWNAELYSFAFED